MAYHEAMIRVAGGLWLCACFDSTMAKQRLAFGQIADSAYLHARDIELTALAQLDADLKRAEQAIVGVFARLRGATAGRY